MFTALALKKVLSWLKNYWWVPVVGIAIVVVFILTRKSPDTLINLIRNARDTHALEVQKLEEIHAEEIGKREDALKMYHLTVQQIEEKYVEQQKELDNKKKKEIRKIIDETKDNPEELTKRISDLTGFEIVYPERDK